jgi:hypothetical protein
VRRLSTFALAALAGCGGPAPKPSFEQSTFTRGDETFHVEAPPRWQPLHSAGDLAWRAPQHDAVIAANATCRGHQDAPLSVLVNDLVMGTTQREVLLDETTMLDGREARHQVVQARLDGVPLVYDLYVLKKDGCVYDLTLVCPPRSYEATADTFVSFVAGFRGKGRGTGD